MPEQLQSLLDRIQKDGLEKADAQGAGIVREAQQKAAAIVKDAESRAAAIVAGAERDGQAFVERGRTALQQAARDTILSVNEAIASVLRAIVKKEVGQALDIETLRRLLGTVAEAYVKDASGTSRIEVLVAPEAQQQLTDYLMKRLAETMRAGVTVKADRALVSGFRVTVRNGQVEHDFSEAAIADALCQIVRPQLAEIVRAAAGRGGGTAKA